MMATIKLNYLEQSFNFTNEHKVSKTKRDYAQEIKHPLCHAMVMCEWLHTII